MELIATQDLTYAARFIAQGEVFEAAGEYDARILVAVGKAEWTPESLRLRTRERYERRDLRAHD